MSHLVSEQKSKPSFFYKYESIFGDLLYDKHVRELGHEKVIIRRIYGYADTGEITRIVSDIEERSYVRFW